MNIKVMFDYVQRLFTSMTNMVCKYPLNKTHYWKFHSFLTAICKFLVVYDIFGLIIYCHYDLILTAAGRMARWNLTENHRHYG